MTASDWFDKPGEPSGRRPFDEVLEEFARRTGRPLWKVTRTMPSYAQPAGFEKQKAEAA